MLRPFGADQSKANAEIISRADARHLRVHRHSDVRHRRWDALRRRMAVTRSDWEPPGGSAALTGW